MVRKLFVAAGILLTGYFVISFIYGFWELYRAQIKDGYKVVPKIADEYIDVFNKRYQSEIIDSNYYSTLECKERNPISFIDYKDYEICVYKIGSGIGQSLNKLIKIKQENNSMNREQVYNVLPNTYYNFQFKSDSVSTLVDEVILVNDAMPIVPIVENDSIQSYYTEFNNLSLQYEEGDSDFFIEKRETLLKWDAEKKNFFKWNNENIPVAILFKKRGKNLFFLMMTSRTNEILEKDLLYKLVTREER